MVQSNADHDNSALGWTELGTVHFGCLNWRGLLPALRARIWLARAKDLLDRSPRRFCLPLRLAG